MNNHNLTPPQSLESKPPKYWLSLDEWRQDPEFLKLAENEFISSPLAEDGRGNRQEEGWARREFLKLMGASLALTSFACVRRPAQKIVPYVKQPLDQVSGIANYYASSFTDGVEGFGILVTSREGRPIKIEGNPEHPVNKGGMSARAHAHILSLYDPERLTAPKENLFNVEKTNKDSLAISWESLDEQVGEAIKGGGVALLTPGLTSPSTQKIVDDFCAQTGAKHYAWDPISQEAMIEGQRRAYGKPALPQWRFDLAKCIVSIDSDFLGTVGNVTEAQGLFATGRKPGADMNKLIVFEGLYSLSGANADDRYRIKPSQQLDVAVALLAEVVGSTNLSTDSEVKGLLSRFANRKSTLPIEGIKKAAAQLLENRGQGLVVAGGLSSQHKRAEDLQVVVNLLNSVLGNEGKTVTATVSPRGSYLQFNQLLGDIESEKVKTLIIHGVNPAYASSPDLLFSESVKKVGLVVYTGDRIDETGNLSQLVAPDHHPLENWGDLEAVEGVYSIQQPTIRPLYETRAFQDSLIAWAKAAGKSAGLASVDSWYDYLRENWRSQLSKRRGSIQVAVFEDFWVQLLQRGVFDARSAVSTSSRGVVTSSLKAIEPLGATEAFELALYSTIGLRDGSLANVSWLQEFPDPVTKICWDNYLTVSIGDSKKFSLKDGDVVFLTKGKERFELPVHVQAGQAEGVLGLAVGFGRTRAGKVANDVGFNAFKLSEYADGRWLASGFATQIEKTEKKYALANVQGHHRMEGREIVVEQTVAQYMKNPKANMHKHKIFSVYEPHKYPKHKWGMVIDLNSCNGCSACIIACQSENNIPTVGKKYVLQGREMHWIRLDRYFVGAPEDVGTVFQPMVCQHCDNAPCEAVCPVAATVHGDEGTNDMIYNRCVGTRYCSNNCPYKVRRFNWFDYTNVQKPLNYAMNPEVTVRHRGVMEKCTFCTHKIKEAKNQLRREGRELKDGDVKTACQISCPTGAIVFGDLNDATSQVAQLFNGAPNTYSLLEEWGTAPAVKYQTKIRNTEKLKVDPGQHSHHEEGHHA